MLYRTYTPGPPLSEFVESFWYYEGGDAPHEKERVLPYGSLGLMINMKADNFRLYDREEPEKFETHRGCLISGAHSEFVVIDSMRDSAILGVRFKPGGAFPFLGLPAIELHNRTVSLEGLWGVRAGRLRERLLEAGTIEERFRLVEQSLLTMTPVLTARHPAVEFALRQFQADSVPGPVNEVTSQIGLSPRRFIQVFSEQVGLTPKLYCRIKRFQLALASIYKSREVDWAALALNCGYFDQAHFIRDFKSFSGVSPTGYLSGRGEYQNHVPLRD